MLECICILIFLVLMPLFYSSDMPYCDSLHVHLLLHQTLCKYLHWEKAEYSLCKANIERVHAQYLCLRCIAWLHHRQFSII